MITDNNKFCYEDCEYLSITEREQDKLAKGQAIPHICKRYNVKVIHNGNHPQLERFEGCDYERKINVNFTKFSINTADPLFNNLFNDWSKPLRDIHEDPLKYKEKYGVGYLMCGFCIVQAPLCMERKYLLLINVGIQDPDKHWGYHSYDVPIAIKIGQVIYTHPSLYEKIITGIVSKNTENWINRLKKY